MIGCYVANYLPASFKGVPFHAVEVTSEHGRRGAEGEFPFAEVTAYADLGIKIDRYTLRGRLQENSHVRDAALLIAACKSPGPGLLIHPTRGAVIAACPRISVTDNVEESQGVTEVDLEFIEANFIGSGFNFAGALQLISLVAITAGVRGAIQRNYRPAEVAFYDTVEVAATATSSIAQVRDQYSAATAIGQSQKDWITISNFNSVVNDSYALSDPDKYGTVLANSLATLETVTEGQSKLTAFRALANWGARASALSAEAGVSQNAVYSAIRILSAGYMARGILETTTTTLDAALEEFDIISTILAEEAEIANTQCADPQLFLDIKDFMISTQASLLQRAYTLPGMVVYKFKGGTHSLAAAYEIYGDARRFKDLEARNPQYLPWAFGPEVVGTEAA